MTTSLSARAAQLIEQTGTERKRRRALRRLHENLCSRIEFVHPSEVERFAEIEFNAGREHSALLLLEHGSYIQNCLALEAYRRLSAKTCGLAEWEISTLCELDYRGIVKAAKMPSWVVEAVNERALDEYLLAQTTVPTVKLSLINWGVRNGLYSSEDVYGHIERTSAILERQCLAGIRAAQWPSDSSRLYSGVRRGTFSVAEVKEAFREGVAAEEKWQKIEFLRELLGRFS